MVHCDICERDVAAHPTWNLRISRALYDAKMREGPWAYLCAEHFKDHGLGLGLGLGSVLKGDDMRADDETGDTREAKRERNRDIPDFDREASEDPRYDYEYGAQESAMKDARGNSMRANEREAWEKIMRAARYGMCDETPETSQKIIRNLIVIAAMRLIGGIK